jgi:hypothetical protein
MEVDLVTVHCSELGGSGEFAERASKAIEFGRDIEEGVHSGIHHLGFDG